MSIFASILSLMLHILLLFSDHGFFQLFLTVANIFMLLYIVNLHLKMTSGRSKRRGLFLSLVFINIFSKGPKE